MVFLHNIVIYPKCVSAARTQCQLQWGTKLSEVNERAQCLQLEQDCRSQPTCQVPAAGGKHLHLLQTQHAWGVCMDSLENSKLDQLGSRRPWLSRHVRQMQGLCWYLRELTRVMCPYNKYASDACLQQAPSWTRCQVGDPGVGKGSWDPGKGCWVCRGDMLVLEAPWMCLCLWTCVVSVMCVLHWWSSASAGPRGLGDMAVCACVKCESWMWGLLEAAPCLWPPVWPVVFMSSVCLCLSLGYMLNFTSGETC